MAARTKSPPVNYASKGAIACNGLLLDPKNSVWLFTVAGALTDGTSGDGVGWAGKGSLALRLDTGKQYINGGTKASPAWKIVTSA